GEGRQPRGLRRDQQAAGHDRVGVIRAAQLVDRLFRQPINSSFASRSLSQILLTHSAGPSAAKTLDCIEAFATRGWYERRSRFTGAPSCTKRKPRLLPI